MNPGATYSIKRPLGGSVFEQQTACEIGSRSGRANHQYQEHEHTMKLWHVRNGQLGYFSGSLNQMSSIVLPSNSEFVVRRVGFAPSRFYIKDTDVATIVKDGSDFVIHSKTSGRTTLHAHNGRDKCRSALFIDVRPIIDLKVCFLFLTDSSGEKAQGYSSSINTIIDEMNEIYLPQTCIRIKNVTPGNPDQLQPVVVKRALGKKIDAGILQDLSLNREIQQQAKTITGKDCPTFFFVWKFLDQYQQGQQRLNNLFIKDGLSKRRRGRVFAHELAHLLTKHDGMKKYFDAAGHATEKGHLLNELGDGKKLTRYEVSLGMYTKAQLWSD